MKIVSDVGSFVDSSQSDGIPDIESEMGIEAQ
jgi:hypothetical protein